MMTRLNAIGVITKRKLFEVAISPGYYIALTLGLALGFVCVFFFADSVGSSGFRTDLNPIYDVASGSLSGIFGVTFVEKLFAEGPYMFALFIAFLPVLLYLAMSSAFTFSFEKNIGAIELIAYGPADGTSYFLASLVKDVVCTAAGIVVLSGFFALTAVLNNLVLGPMFFYSIVLLFFFAVGVFSYGILSSVITDNEASSTALFVVIFAFFSFVQIGSFALTSGYVRNLSSVFGAVIRWISPVFYWQAGLDAVDGGMPALYALDLLLLLLVSATVLVASHFILRLRGVRA
jgi:hypothetical protein